MGDPRHPPVPEDFELVDAVGGIEKESLEPPETVEDWEPLEERLKSKIVDRSLSWYWIVVLTLAGLAIMGVTWDRLLAVGAALVTGVLVPLVLVLFPRAVGFSSTSSREHMIGSTGFRRKPKHPPKPR